MANKYTANIDGVIVGKRTSKSREYSHCIAVKWDREYSLRAAKNTKVMAQDAANWAYWMASEKHRRWTSDKVIERAMEAKSGAEYAENEAQRITALIMADTERYAKWHVVTWCGRPDLAAKEHVKWSGRADVAQCRILEADKL